MALIECAECKRQISDQARTCPGCGAVIAARPTAQQGKKRLVRWALIGVGVAIVLIAVMGIVGEQLPDSDATIAAAAERTWSQQFKDPTSVEWRNVTVLMGKQSSERVVCGEVNARNGFGAYTGFYPFAGYVFLAYGHADKISQILVADDSDSGSLLRGTIAKICSP